eukprot:scpid69012/ scgid30403/ 
MASIKPLYLVQVVLVLVLAWWFSGRIVIFFNVGCGFVAKTICSGVFVANRSALSMHRHDLSPISRLLVNYEVDYQRKCVNSSIWLLQSLFASTAVYNGHYTGCSVIADADLYESQHRALFEAFRDEERPVRHTNANAARAVRQNKAVQDAVDAEFTLAAFESSHTRALVVLHRGELIAEGYASEHIPDIGVATGHLGWSMTKTLMAILVGMRIRQGHLSLDEVVHGNATLRNVLQMADILPVKEGYDATDDMPVMLFSKVSVMEFIQSYDAKSGREPLGTDAWYYSSALSNVLSDVLRRTFDTTADYWRFPREALFGVIGADSIVLETDQSGLYVASTFGYATARDWAKVGQLLVQKGRWNDERLFDESYADFLTARAPGSGGVYGGQLWCVDHRPVPASTPLFVQRERVTVNYLLRASPPQDTCFLSGHDGQFVLMSPSLNLVVARLGDTPGMVASQDPALWGDWHPKWNISRFFKSVLDGIES